MSLKIKQKLILYITLFIFLAVFAVTIPAITYFSNEMEKTHEKQVVQGMEGLNNLLEQYKREITNYGVLLAQHPQIIKAVEEKDTATLRRIVTPLARAANFDSVTISDDKGIVIARTHDTKIGDSVLNQSNVKLALNGTTSAAVESGTVVRLSVRAGVPVKNSDGKIVGVITPGYNASRDEIVDRVKELFNVENTIFLGDERVATTIMQDGKRVIGTKLNEKIADKVLKQGQVYTGRADILGQEYVTAYMPLLGPDNKSLGVLFAGHPTAELAASKLKMIGTISIIAIGVLILCLGLTLWLAHGITGPIQKLGEIVGLVADGDLTKKAAVTSKDEIGLMTEGFNRMVDQLHSLVLQVNQLSSTLVSSSEVLNASADQSASAAGLVAKSVTEIAAGTHRQSASVTDITGVAGVIADSTDQISRKTQDVAVIAQTTAQQAEQGRQTVEETVAQMEQIRQGSETVQQAISELAKGSQEISEIINVISSIAGQTNLLALNAAIEAARAGEQGRGFAVVAEEVRKLAEESNQAAQKISGLIQKNQLNMDQAVSAMASGAGSVKNGIHVVNSTGDTFKTIIASIIQLSQEIQVISSAIEQIVGSSHKLVDEIKEIAEVGKATAVEVETVSAATEEQAASMEEIASSSHQLSGLAAKLQQAVEKFRVR